MTALRVYTAEAWHELREGLRSSLVPLMFVGLVGYVFMMLLNAEYLRKMGGADVPRNSPLIVFQMTAGQSFWLIFAWAWVFAQVVTRDRAASLHELVLAAPVSLRGLLLARFAGAVALACVLGSSSSVGLLLVPALAHLGVLPSEAVGPMPLGAIVWAWLLFVLPSAVGLGSLYLVAALRTRSTAGPFAVSAVVILLWMAAMVVLRGGDIATNVATWIDVSGFGEAERQTKLWTPHEKATALLVLNQPLFINRILWTLLPLGVLGWMLARLRREDLLLERAARPADPERAQPPAPVGALVLPPRGRPSIARAWLSEVSWHLGRATKGWAFLVTVVLWTMINVAGPFVHMVAHAEGPLVPRAKLLAPFLVDLCYVFSVFVVAGFVGALVRRDQRSGFEEMLDATPAPFGVRVLARAAAAAVLTMILALVPALSAWLVMAAASGVRIEPLDPVAFNALVAAPALLELCGLTFFIHACVRAQGTAYALSMLAAFIAIVNHELELVSYPPAQFGIPAHVALSELAGWRAWLAPLFTLDALKLSCFALLVALAWMVCPRGTDQTWRALLQRLRRHSRQGAGALAASSLLAIIVSAAVLWDRLVARGGFESPHERAQADAAWEDRFWRRAAEFGVEGGEVTASIDPSARTASVRWVLRGVTSSSGQLHGSMPIGMKLDGARVQGVTREVVAGQDHFELELGACPAPGCEVTLDLHVDQSGWPTGESPPWLHASGVWARASDLLPRLGHDPERVLRSPQQRREFGLSSSRPPVPPAAAFVAAGGAVAPAGHWSWSVRLPAAGVHTPSQGNTREPLDFALVWLPESVAVHQQGGLSVWHGPTQREVAAEVREDVEAMRACVSSRLGWEVAVSTVVQVPRALGEVGVHGTLLWLPEHAGWDVGPVGVGRLKRRAELARALAAHWLASAADLRAEPGWRWLGDGVAGWAGLECVHATDGTAAWLALFDRQSERVAESLGALGTPIAGLASDGSEAWVAAYAPLSMLSWSESVGMVEALRVVGSVVSLVRSRVGVRDALARSIGTELAQRWLGVPWASEVSVGVSSTGAPEARGERYDWRDGGWHFESSTFDIMQRFEADVAPALAAKVPAALEGARAFTVLDVAPSYERSPLNNAWPGAVPEGVLTQAGPRRGALP